MSTANPARRLELVPLSELKQAKRNPKAHDVAYLSTAIGDAGLVDLLVVDDRTGRLVAGHGRLKTLAAMFERDAKAPPDGVTLDRRGRWLVPVVRGWCSRDDDHATAVGLALNRGTERGGWGPDLADVLKGLPQGPLFDLAGFSLDDLDAITRATTPRTGDLEAELVVPSGADVKVRLGDVWQLGEHVLVCGRSPGALLAVLGKRKRAALVTDPPYGIDVVGGDRAVGGGGWGKPGRYERVAGDSEPFDPKPYLELAPRVVLFGANHYADKLPPSPSWLVWDKREGLASNDFADAELAWSNLKGPVRVFRHRWSGMLKASERGERRQHPTQKPVALFEWVLERAKLKRGDLVLDPFVGSGSCLLACETTGRVCFAAELVPAYAQVTINRWEALTGKRAGVLERKAKGRRK